MHLTAWRIRKLAEGPSVEGHWIVPLIPSPPWRNAIKWLTSLHSPKFLTETPFSCSIGSEMAYSLPHVNL